MAKKKAVKAAPQTPYTATAIILGKKYTGTGNSASEAIGAIAPGIAKGRCILTVSVNDTTKERVLTPVMVQRLFTAKGMTRDVAIKNTSLLFGL